MKTILGIDLSTKASGWALYEIKSKKLLENGVLKSTTSGLSKYKPLHSKLIRLERMAIMIDNLVDNLKPDLIVIEEITNGKNRLTQKTLDGQHWILLTMLRNYLLLDLIFYYDVSGREGWRTDLKLKLNITDKLKNRQARKLNKRLSRKQPKLKIINTKHLSVRFVNKQLSLDLNCDKNTTDGDIADAVAMTYAFIRFRLNKALRKRGMLD